MSLPLRIDTVQWQEGCIQGITIDRDRKYIFSFTTEFVKLDMDGNLIGSVRGSPAKNRKSFKGFVIRRNDNHLKVPILIGTFSFFCRNGGHAVQSHPSCLAWGSVI